MWRTLVRRAVQARQPASRCLLQRASACRATPLRRTCVFAASSSPCASWRAFHAASHGTSVGDAAFFGEDESFDRFGLHPELLQRLERHGFVRPSRLQSQSLDMLLQGRDVVLNSETGSGKTLAFLLPMLQALFKNGSVDETGALTRSQTLSGVIVVPTIDLARQICSVIAQLLPELNRDDGVFMVHGRYGPTRHQTPSLIVATPTALVDNVRSKLMRRLEFLVVDEVDLLVSGTQLQSLQDFLSSMKMRPEHQRPQHIFAAATLPSAGKKSVRRWLDNYYGGATTVSTPLAHHVNPQLRQMYVRLPDPEPLDSADEDGSGAFGVELDHEAVEQVRIRVLIKALQQQLPTAPPRDGSDAITDDRDNSAAGSVEPLVAEATDLVKGDGVETDDMGALVRHEDGIVVPGTTLVFVNSARRATEVVEELRRLVPTLVVEQLSKNVDDEVRKSLRDRVLSGEVRVLVSTDVGARGLDYEVDHVIQMDMATEARGHLHRIGRTARAGQPGMSTSIFGKENAPLVERLLETKGALDSVFSRKRSFRRRLKKQAREAEAQAE